MAGRQEVNELQQCNKREVAPNWFATTNPYRRRVALMCQIEIGRLLAHPRHEKVL